MFRALFFILKITFFSLLVLVVANKIHWGRHTLSDEVKIRVAQAERSPIYKRIMNLKDQAISDLKENATDQISEKANDWLED